MNMISYWTADEWQRALEMKREGWSYATIGAALGRTATAVRRRFEDTKNGSAKAIQRAARAKAAAARKSAGRDRSTQTPGEAGPVHGRRGAPSNAAPVRTSADLTKAERNALLKRLVMRAPGESLPAIAQEYGVAFRTVANMHTAWVEIVNAGNTANIKERRCLRCSEMFLSAHAGHRICTDCAPTVARTADVTGYRVLR